jgi:hypothetical protein
MLADEAEREMPEPFGVAGIRLLLPTLDPVGDLQTTPIVYATSATPSVLAAPYPGVGRNPLASRAADRTLTAAPGGRCPKRTLF